jgi:hypothetical protein
MNGCAFNVLNGHVGEFVESVEMMHNTLLGWSGSWLKRQLVERQLVKLLQLVAFGRLHTTWLTEFTHILTSLYIVNQKPLVVISRPTVASAKWLNIKT